MSSSSSTIKISSAISCHYPVVSFVVSRVMIEFFEHIGIKSDADACPATCRIFKSDFAEMLLDDLLDDREAQPRTLLPGRHVRFDNPVALGGQSNTVVLNGNSQLAFLIIVQPHLDTAIRSLLFGNGFNGFNGILDDIGQSLPDLPPDRKSTRLNSSH